MTVVYSEAEMGDIIACVKRHNYYLLNDNLGGMVQKIDAIGTIADVDGYIVVALFKGKQFSVNTIYIDGGSGMPHISRGSVGTELDTREHALEDVVEYHNTSNRASLLPIHLVS